MHDSARTADAVSRGLDWLIADQAPTGELSSYASPLGDGVDVGWTPDSLKFITALIALAVADVDDPRAATIVDGAVRFLRSEREHHALWRYWTSANELFEYTPPDADDTACSSMAVALRGDDTSANVALLLANRDRTGRFFTWLIPHRDRLTPRFWWAVRDEFRRATRARRQELWENSEAWPADVDGVVNANVVRYLGPGRAPASAVEFVTSIITDEREDDCDSWHRNRSTLYASIADGHRRGITSFAPLGPVIIDQITERIDAIAAGPALDCAQSLVALHRLGAPAAPCDRLHEALLDTQLPDGSWERSVFYYGGPQEVFGWASEALSTAVAVQALSLRAD
ncbi:MAG: hypothetical protein ACK4V6_16105 [Microthrixaceae bacterium]